MVSLNAKSYFCWDRTDATKNKYSSKGINKSLKLSKEVYLNVLFGKESKEFVNSGFIYKDKSMFSYKMKKAGLVYLYAKRKVENNGFSTTYLDI